MERNSHTTEIALFAISRAMTREITFSHVIMLLARVSKSAIPVTSFFSKHGRGEVFFQLVSYEGLSFPILLNT